MIPSMEQRPRGSIGSTGFAGEIRSPKQRIRRAADKSGFVDIVPKTYSHFLKTSKITIALVFSIVGYNLHTIAEWVRRHEEAEDASDDTDASAAEANPGLDADASHGPQPGKPPD
jgi:hypothetical protein